MRTPTPEYAQKAIEYASKVIDSGDYQLRSRESIMEYIKPAPDANPEAIFAVKRIASEYSGFDHYYGVGGMYANIGGMGWGEMFASQKYMDLLDETGRNDRRNDKFVDARAAYIEPTYQDKEVARFTFVSDNGDVNYAQLDITRNGVGNITAKDGDDTYQLTPSTLTRRSTPSTTRVRPARPTSTTSSPSTAPTRSSTSTSRAARLRTATSSRP